MSRWTSIFDIGIVLQFTYKETERLLGVIITRDLPTLCTHEYLT